MTSLAKIGILSIGDMGMGLAKLLAAEGFSPATCGKGRSQDTVERAKSAQVEVLRSDEDLTQACDVVLSVVPPRDAIATAERIVDSLTGPLKRSSPLYFVDLNAIAPSTTRHIAELVQRSRAPIRFVDGCILGNPPSLKENGGEWATPRIPTSGPHKLTDIPQYGERLVSTLRMRHISDDIGAASGLKMSFASMSKGLTAIAIQSFTTAQRLGILDELKAEMALGLPSHLAVAEKAVVGMAPKAYRWVREMEEIALTFDEDGGFSQDMFRGAAQVYRTVADDTELGREKVGKRKRGTDVNDMAKAMAEGMEKRKKKDD